MASAIAASACNFASSAFSVEIVSSLLVLLENKGGLETDEVVEVELMPVLNGELDLESGDELRFASAVAPSPLIVDLLELP